MHYAKNRGNNGQAEHGVEVPGSTAPAGCMRNGLQLYSVLETR